MIIWGYKTRTTRVKNGDVLEKSCPNCSGDLEKHDLKRWFTLYFVPLFPLSKIESLYKCASCGEAYKEEIKQALKKRGKQQKQAISNQKKAFVMTLAACMAHMAKSDGISKKEKQELDELKKGFPEYKKDIQNTVNLVSKAKNDALIFTLLGETRNYLKPEGVMMIIGRVARVVLADGKVSKKEENLMKDYLVACGIPKSAYKLIIKKAEEALAKEKKAEKKK